MKILAKFPGNPTLEILIKIHNCVGSTNMRGRFMMKVCLFPILNCPVILGYFLGWVYLILVNLRNFNPRKSTFLDGFWYKTIFPPSVQKSFSMKNLEKVEKIMNILEFSKKFQHFSAFLGVCFHMNRLKIKYLSTEKTSKNPRNST